VVGKTWGKAWLALAALVVAVLSAPSTASAASCAWMDVHKSPEQRADLLIKAMSFDLQRAAVVRALRHRRAR
jgi:hypothetical protein